jgi:hypothetical protein
MTTYFFNVPRLMSHACDAIGHKGIGMDESATVALALMRIPDT